MAKKENNNGGNGTSAGGDITMLRNILMGQQISEYDTRFDILEARSKEREIAFQNKIQHLEKQLEERTLQIQEDMSLRLSKLEHLLDSQIEKADAKNEDQRLKARQEIGQMLLEMSKRFLD